MLKKLRVKFVCIMMTFVTIMLCVIFGLVIFFTGQGLEMQRCLLNLANSCKIREYR